MDSRIYSFLDRKQNFAIHFLEGEKIISEILQTHCLTEKSTFFFNDLLLSTLPMIHFLKSGESIGLYLDSDRPSFQFKIEANSSGFFRTLLYPEKFDDFPSILHGMFRTLKFMGQGLEPYVSYTKLDSVELHQAINLVIKESYQMEAEVFVSPTSSRSLLVTKLPLTKNELMAKVQGLTISEYILVNKKHFYDLFDSLISNEVEIFNKFESLNFTFLSSKAIELKCSCSMQRFIESLTGLYQNNLAELFNNQEILEIKCEYCKKLYQISMSDFKL